MGKDRSRGRSEIGTQRRIDGDRREFQFYGRRYGHRLRDGRKRLIEEVLPAFRLTGRGDGDTIDLDASFGGKKRAYWLEIGFGAGEHLAQQAEANPEVGFVGCEPFINGVAALLAKIDGTAVTNIRLFDDDARFLLADLPDASISRVFLLFSDPWPKKKHHKRRFVNAENLEALSRIMVDGGEFRFASDDMGFVSWTLERLTAHPDFDWVVSGPNDWRTRPNDGVETRYERKALDQGKSCVYLSFRRRPRS